MKKIIALLTLFLATEIHSQVSLTLVTDYALTPNTNDMIGVLSRENYQ